MSAVAVTTRTLYPSSYDDGSSSTASSSSRAPTTITQLVTKTLASDAATNVPLDDFSAGARASSGATLGLAIGLPVGLFCLGLVVFLSYFYWKDSSVDLGSPRIGGKSKQVEDKGLFSTFLYGGGNSEDNDSYLNVKRIPSMSSRIQYKISRPVPQHIQTPKAPICKDSAAGLPSVEVEDNVDAFLYSRPPNIYHIDSKMPSMNHLVGSGVQSSGDQQSVPSAGSGDKGSDSQPRKWNYQSPLSRWFLRSSVYLHDGFTLPGSIRTPTIQLKQLKILSRIHKDYADSSQFLEDEKSPILDKASETCDYSERAEVVESSEIFKVLTPTSALYGAIDPQFLEVKDENWASSAGLELKPVPSNADKFGRKRKTRRQSRLRKHLKQVSDVKPLPAVPNVMGELNEKLRVGYVYKVIQEYKARLADEIYIKEGECVQVLATHTDGWCLVEKCAPDGSSRCRKEHGNSVNDKGYLNEDRGIIPGDCLKET